MKGVRRPKAGSSIRCWRCGLPDHVVKDCPDPLPLSASITDASPAIPSTSSSRSPPYSTEIVSVEEMPVASVSTSTRPPKRAKGTVVTRYWLGVDDETDEPVGFYVEDVVGGTASSQRE